MKTLPATYAANHFGELLDTVRREPVAIERGKGKRLAAVMISLDEFQLYQALKAEVLRRDLEAGLGQAEAGEWVNGEVALRELHASS